MRMSNKKSLREQVKHLALFASNSKDLDNVVEEVLNFVRNEKKNAIREFLLKNTEKTNESFFSKGQGEKTTELFKR